MKTETMNFAGQNAIITGAGSKRGFGVAISKQLAGFGCNVALADIDYDGAVANAKMIEETYGVKAVAISVDLSDEQSVIDMVKTAADAFDGRIDILVNNAGVSIPHAYNEISNSEWRKVLDINLSCVFQAIREVAPYMIKAKYGRVVTISSVAGRDGGHHGGAHYVATKGAVVSLSKHYAKALATEGITVNCVAPGQCLTDGGGLKLEDRKPNPACPMLRRGTADEIAAAVVFLASPGASYITGVNLDVNGGLYMP